jgi:hypothetical protein
MRKVVAFGALVWAIASGTAFAQSLGVVQLPGSLNLTAGTLAPTEKDNVISSMTMEQGFTSYRRGLLFVVGFVNMTVRHDTDGMPWNRTDPATAGLKLVSVTKAGVAQAVLGINAYDRGDSIRASKAAYMTYWSGWRIDRASGDSAILPDAYPGWVNASSGYVTSAEPTNFISALSVQQGATVLRLAGVSLTPFAGAAAGMDSKGNSWNNRVNAEAGMKISREILSGVVEIGMANRREHNRLTRETRVAPVVFVNLWIGWSPAIVRSGR